MEVKNGVAFLLGVTALVLGAFIVTFDYPQILYFERMPPESYYLLDPGQKGVHQRLLVEGAIGGGIAAAGAGMVALSLARKGWR